MPHSRILLVRLFLFSAVAFAIDAHAAEWRECEKAKLHELQLQRHTEDHKPARRKSYRRRDAERDQSAEEIDTWLWKNCREFSYELRQLEQDKM